jgi:hypothetical protein
MADKTVNISWSIIPPDPNDLNYAEVRRSDDGVNFNNTIIKTESNLGALPAGVQANFTATDTITVAINSTKTVWYRIKVYDNDENYNNSNIEQITFEMLPPPAPVLNSVVEA